MLKIRKAKKEDIIQLIKIYKRVWNNSENKENWTNEKIKRLLDFYFNYKTFIGLVAMIDNKIVGAFFSFIKPWHDGNHLGEGELFVDSDYQKQKIGTKLFFEMMKEAKRRKCIIHELISYEKTSRWYKKIGMKETGLKHLSGNIGRIIKKIKL